MHQAQQEPPLQQMPVRQQVDLMQQAQDKALMQRRHAEALRR